MSSHSDFHGGRTYFDDTAGSVPGSFARLKAKLATLFGAHKPSPQPSSSRAEAARMAREDMARMFQVIDGPGAHHAVFGAPASHRPAELQDN